MPESLLMNTPTLAALNDGLIAAHRQLGEKSAQYVAERQKVERLRRALLILLAGMRATFEGTEDEFEATWLVMTIRAALSETNS